ncbi:MAG: ABC transporter ATP-binding protein [Spirochaetaceae bacterium]|jgi:putative ABC transport system ATP-binding protein|nr:ABC transporter ATP-binding protein [Spirochaetaceae bacterium]
MAVIELRDIRREYRLEGVMVRALRGINFSVETGEFISIMGPSGSGKSTLMNILGCLDKPSGGTYTLDGIETSCSSPDAFAQIRNKKIGFVFQAFNLLPRTQAVENVELPLFYRGKERTSGGGGLGNPLRGRERAVAVLREVGLGDRLTHLPNQLSGGQQQRVAIARAMVNDPAFILADEPTGNLDTEMALEIMSLFQALNNRGKTIIMVTHEPELAAYTKRIITLRDGEILRDQRVAEPRNAPEDLAQWRRDHNPAPQGILLDGGVPPDTGERVPRRAGGG